MDYEKLHKDTIAKLQEMVNSGKITVKTACSICADFVSESEDERIKKAIIEHFSRGKEVEFPELEEKYNTWIAWLEKQGAHAKFRDSIQVGDKVTRNEDGVLVNLSQLNRVAKKQGEQKPAGKVEPKDYNSIDPHFGKPINKIEPKFHEGDWIIHRGTENIYQVVAVIDNQYQLNYGDNYTIQKCADVDRCVRLWDITKDAKDGDVLADGHHILILKELGYTWASNGKPESLYAYCGIKPNGEFETEKKNYCFCGALHTHPATKEQRDLLFQKMKEAGYEWDAEKKELRKIEQNSAEWHSEDEQNLNACLGYIPDEFLRRWLTDIIHVKYDKHNDKVKPKFKVGDTVKDPYGDLYHITEITDNSYKTDDGRFILFINQEVYTLSNFTAWSEEDEAKMKSILFHIEDVENKDVINWFKSLKNRVQPQPKQEWNEEDERLFQIVIDILDRQNHLGNISHTDLIACVRKLKSLRPQNNITDEELAQAKKNAYNDALDKIEYHSGEPTFDDGWSAAIWYLKKRNTIPQSQWKPSDKQLH